MSKKETTMECLEPLMDLSEENGLGWCKRLSIVRQAGQLYYHIGVWDSAGNLKNLGHLFTEAEIKRLAEGLEKVKERELELKQFERDYIQQSHNGVVCKKMEVELL